MIPQRFAEANTVLTAPAGMPEVREIHAFRNGARVITCWRPSAEELVRINLGEPVWLSVAGRNMPPVCVTCEDPFVRPGAEIPKGENDER